MVGSLGSNFTASLFAPPGQKIVSVAPAAWADGYFIRLFQHVQARHADLRGASVAQNGVAEERAPHLVDTGDLEEAMEAVLACEDNETCTIDGELMPRRLRAPLLSLSFAQDGIFPAEVTGTWSAPEPSHRWSLGESSGLTISRANLTSTAPLWLEIEGQRPCLSAVLAHASPQDSGGRPAGRQFRCDRPGQIYLPAHTPQCWAATAPSHSPFLHPVCPSPRMMGASADDRPLGFGFEKTDALCDVQLTHFWRDFCCVLYFQRDIKTGSVLLPSTCRVTPPRISSRNRECE